MPNIEKYYEIKERSEELKKMFSILSEEEQKFIDLYFGFGFQYGEPIQYNQNEIAKILGISRSKVTKMKKKILLTLKEQILLQREKEKQMEEEKKYQDSEKLKKKYFYMIVKNCMLCECS